MLKTHKRILNPLVLFTVQWLAGCQGPSASSAPMLVVESGVFLPEVPEGETANAELALRNAGDGPLTLFQADLVAPPAWRRVDWPHLPYRLNPDERLALRLEYTSARDDAAGGVWIESDDFDRPRIRVPLGGLAPQPSVEPTMPDVSFGAVETGGASDSTVRIANGGSGTLGVHDVTLQHGSSADFSITSEVASALAPGEWFEVVVTYRPTGGGSDDGALVVATDDPRRPFLVVPLHGEQELPEVY
ncbi:MAG: choice-of-anchor D domain-containing protein [Myxococcota bacterium]